SPRFTASTSDCSRVSARRPTVATARAAARMTERLNIIAISLARKGSTAELAEIAEPFERSRRSPRSRRFSLDAGQRLELDPPGRVAELLHRHADLVEQRHVQVVHRRVLREAQMTAALERA